MDANDQFTLKAASVLRRVRNFPLTDAHVWGDAEPHTFYPDPMPHRNSLAHRVTSATAPLEPAAATELIPAGSSAPEAPAEPQ